MFLVPWSSLLAGKVGKVLQCLSSPPPLIEVIFSYKYGFFLFWLHYIFQDECKKPEFSEMRGRGGPGPPKGVIEKNLNVPKTPLSPNFWLKISTLSSLKLFISFPNTSFDFWIFSSLPPKNRFLGYKFFSKKPKNLKKSILTPKLNFSMKQNSWIKTT